VASILRARRERRWVDASQLLERWVASCHKQAPASAPEMVTMNSGPMGRMFTTRRFGRQGSYGDDEDEQRMLNDLRERLPKIGRQLDKPTEKVTFAIMCNKHNEHGKVQARLLVVSDQAVYNLSVDAKKCKRRIPLAHISLLSASEPMSQIVIHVPHSYDYLFTVPARGYAPLDDALVEGAPLAGLIDALQRANAPHSPSGSLPVRTDGGPLAALVKKKKRGGGDEGGGAASFRDDDDDDDE
jgi:hypothetical protein